MDNILRDHRAGFRQDRGCIDQNATLRIIVEVTNGVDYEKAFDSLDRHIVDASSTLWYTRKCISLIRNTHDRMTCKFTHAGQLTQSFQVKAGVRVRQGCFLSPFMFLLAIDWIMKSTKIIEEMESSGPFGAAGRFRFCR